MAHSIQNEGPCFIIKILFSSINFSIVFVCLIGAALARGGSGEHGGSSGGLSLSQPLPEVFFGGLELTPNLGTIT